MWHKQASLDHEKGTKEKFENKTDQSFLRNSQLLSNKIFFVISFF